MTWGGIGEIFNPGQRHMDEELASKRVEAQVPGDEGHPNRVDLDAGIIRVTRPAGAGDHRPAPADPEPDWPPSSRPVSTWPSSPPARHRRRRRRGGPRWEPGPRHAPRGVRRRPRPLLPERPRRRRARRDRPRRRGAGGRGHPAGGVGPVGRRGRLARRRRRPRRLDLPRCRPRAGGVDPRAPRHLRRGTPRPGTRSASRTSPTSVSWPWRSCSRTRRASWPVCVRRSATPTRSPRRWSRTCGRPSSSSLLPARRRAGATRHTSHCVSAGRCSCAPRAARTTGGGSSTRRAPSPPRATALAPRTRAQEVLGGPGTSPTDLDDAVARARRVVEDVDRTCGEDGDQP